VFGRNNLRVIYLFKNFKFFWSKIIYLDEKLKENWNWWISRRYFKSL